MWEPPSQAPRAECLINGGSASSRVSASLFCKCGPEMLGGVVPPNCVGEGRWGSRKGRHCLEEARAVPEGGVRSAGLSARRSSKFCAPGCQ